MPPPKNNGKGNTPQSLVPSVVDHDDLSEGVIVSEIELEYDENASIEESDDSGSEFEASEDSDSELEYVVKSRKSPRKQSLPITDEDFLVDDESSDEVMLDAAIQASLQTAHLDQAARNGVGSSRQSLSSNPAAALRAAAAERRIARANQAIDVDDDAAFVLEYESDALSSSEEEALSKTKGKGKGKGKAPNKSTTVYDTTSTKFMSISERRRLNREQRKLASASKRENRKEELKMLKLLGRPLTYVRL